MPKNEPPDHVEVTRLEAIALARLLWQIVGTEGVNHDVQMQALSFANALDTRALMPPWPTPGIGRDQVVAHLNFARDVIDRKLAGLVDE